MIKMFGNKKSFIFILLLVLCVCVFSFLLNSNKPIPELNSSKKIDNKKDTLIILYKNKCKLCEMSKPSIKKAYNKYHSKNKKDIYMVEGTTELGKSLKQTYDLQGYSDIIRIKYNKESIIYPYVKKEVRDGKHGYTVDESSIRQAFYEFKKERK